MWISLSIAAIMLVASAMLLWLGSRMWRGTLAPNYWAGARTTKALQSDTAWYAVQKQCAPGMLGLGVAYFDTAVLFVVQAMYYETISLLIPTGLMLFQSVVGIVFLHMSAAQAKTNEPQTK